MAKKRAKPKGGPYLAAAFFCETVIQDKADDALSAIRIIDSINVVVPPSAATAFPSEENQLPVPVTAVLSFQRGNSPTEHVVRLVMESPSGKENPPYEQTIPFSGAEHGGANLTLKSTILVSKRGVFWLNVYLDNELITRMPLRSAIQKTDSRSPNQSATADSGR